MEKNTLLEQKRAAFQSALDHKEGAYVPNMIYAGNATIAWAGKRAVDILDDPAAYVAALTQVFDEMWADANLVCGAQIGNKMIKAFGTIENRYGPDGNTLEHIQLSPMQKDEYPQLIADPNKFVRDVLLPRKYPEFFADRDKAKESLKLFVEDRVHVLTGLMRMSAKLLEDKYGIVSPQTVMPERIEPPLDLLFDYFRGFRGTLTDLRRQPENVKAALDKLWEVRCEPRFAKPFAFPGGFVPQMTHIPAYLSPKQFEELYWPHQKRMIERVAAGGGKAFVIMEGRWEKIMHHFLELPKDSCILVVDEDDIVAVHKMLGHHHIICGGLRSADTRLKSFDKIKDDVMRVIDNCAPGGGFLFCTDKLWIAPGDVNQTLIDAYNFAHEYSKK